MAALLGRVGAAVLLLAPARAHRAAVLHHDCGKAWAQCGGVSFTGDECCEDGCTCQKSDDWYSQCIPPGNSGATCGGASTTTTATTTTASGSLTCSTTDSSDCTSESQNAVNNGNLNAFFNRCCTEGGASPLRLRCSLCCSVDGADAYYQDLGTCGGGTVVASASCTAISSQATDQWCVDNCNHNPPHCPAAMCSCAADKCTAWLGAGYVTNSPAYANCATGVTQWHTDNGLACCAGDGNGGNGGSTDCASPAAAVGYESRALILNEGVDLGGAVQGYCSAACAAWCDRTAGCNSFAWRPDDNACWLKSRCPQPGDVTNAAKLQGEPSWRTFSKAGCAAVTPSTPVSSAPTVSPTTCNNGAPAGFLCRGLVGPSVSDEGIELGGHMDMSLEQCAQLCRDTRGCRSFAYSTRLRDCWTKDKCVRASDPAATKLATEPEWKTYYRPTEQCTGVDRRVVVAKLRLRVKGGVAAVLRALGKLQATLLAILSADVPHFRRCRCLLLRHIRVALRPAREADRRRAAPQQCTEWKIEAGTRGELQNTQVSWCDANCYAPSTTLLHPACDPNTEDIHRHCCCNSNGGCRTTDAGTSDVLVWVEDEEGVSNTGQLVNEVATVIADNSDTVTNDFGFPVESVTPALPGSITTGIVTAAPVFPTTGAACTLSTGGLVQHGWVGSDTGASLCRCASDAAPCGCRCDDSNLRCSQAYCGTGFPTAYPTVRPTFATNVRCPVPGRADPGDLVVRGCNNRGTSIGSSVMVDSACLCADHCRQVSGCVGWSFAPGSAGRGECWAKSCIDYSNTRDARFHSFPCSVKAGGAALLSAALACQADPEVTSGPITQYEVRSLVHDGGTELAGSMDTSLSGCEQLCANTPGCQSFAYNARLRDCWVMDGCITAQQRSWTAKLAREPRWQTHYTTTCTAPALPPRVAKLLLRLGRALHTVHAALADLRSALLVALRPSLPGLQLAQILLSVVGSLTGARHAHAQQQQATDVLAWVRQPASSSTAGTLQSAVEATLSAPAVQSQIATATGLPVLSVSGAQPGSPFDDANYTAPITSAPAPALTPRPVPAGPVNLPPTVSIARPIVDVAASSTPFSVSGVLSGVSGPEAGQVVTASCGTSSAGLTYGPVMTIANGEGTLSATAPVPGSYAISCMVGDDGIPPKTVPADLILRVSTAAASQATPPPLPALQQPDDNDDGLASWAIAVIVVAAVLCCILAAVAVFCIFRGKKGGEAKKEAADPPAAPSEQPLSRSEPPAAASPPAASPPPAAVPKAAPPAETYDYSQSYDGSYYDDYAEYAPGTRVHALYLDGEWYDATVREVQKDGRYSIEWYDGSFSDHVPYDQLAPLPPPREAGSPTAEVARR